MPGVGGPLICALFISIGAPPQVPAVFAMLCASTLSSDVLTDGIRAVFGPLDVFGIFGPFGLVTSDATDVLGSGGAEGPNSDSGAEGPGTEGPLGGAAAGCNSSDCLRRMAGPPLKLTAKP